MTYFFGRTTFRVQRACELFSRLEMSSLGGDRRPIVITSVGIPDWRLDQLRGVDVIERSQLNGDIVTSDFLNMTTAE